MKRMELERRVTSIFRSTALMGSDRDVPLNEPLMDLGLGLDSLGVIGFIVGLEKAFGIEVPDRIWDGKEELTLNYFVDLILDLKAQPFLEGSATPNPDACGGMTQEVGVTRNMARGNFLTRLFKAFSQLFGSHLPIYFLTFDGFCGMLDLSSIL